MKLTHLSLTNFRSFARLDVDVPAGSLVLVGGNAQGKTSLLEAVYFLATFVSFQATSDRQLINFLAAREPLAVARIVADFTRGEKSHRLEVRIIQETKPNGLTPVRKEALLDGSTRRLTELMGQFNAVQFLPHMLHVIDGPPEERRRFINLVLAQALPGYAGSVSEYQRALTQRNALLKQINERGGDPRQLDFWDDKLSAAGAQLMYFRIQALQELERLAARLLRDLTRSQELFRLVYVPSYEPLPQRAGQIAMPLDAPVDRSGILMEKILLGFREALHRRRSQEIARGMTTIGPHRDELRFLANGIDLGVYGSRGQVRTAMLALKLAEVAWMQAKTGHAPVLLLDEVLAELDQTRRQDLLERLAGADQALMTTTDLDLFTPEFTAAAQIWRIAEGRIVP
jgi:DNA replication and repair protein RecF